MLRNYVDNETICECLADVYEVAVKNTYGDSEFEQAKLDLIRYNRIEPLFGDAQKLKTVVKYFELIREVGETRDNSDYWLQFGIACTISKRMEAAKNAFDNAYSRERAKARPNTTNIDNYYARYLLERAATDDDPIGAFHHLKDGVGLLLKQIFKDDNRHYPFKAVDHCQISLPVILGNGHPSNRRFFWGTAKPYFLRRRNGRDAIGRVTQTFVILIKEAKKILEKAGRWVHLGEGRVEQPSWCEAH